jgi:eukaryotic-like serine/threonine-protein kinase
MAPETPRSPLNIIETQAAGNLPHHAPTFSSPSAGQLIAERYLLKSPLGEGGMGHVYLADDQFLARQVAIKTVRPELSGNEEVRERIRSECRMHAAIGAHPHIVTLYDSIAENERLYLIMEYFAGETLAQRLATRSASPPLFLEQALHIVHQVLRALACIHGHEIVHRDIKTANILLQRQSDTSYLVKLTDFGIARTEADWSDHAHLTELGVQGPGTPTYMAPERIDPRTYGDIRPATDLYAVGIMLYEMLAGTPPFKGSMTEVFTGHLLHPPNLDRLPPSVSPEIRKVLQKVLAKQPTDRYQHADIFSRALGKTTPTPCPQTAPTASQHHATLLAITSTPPVHAATILVPVHDDAPFFALFFARHKNRMFLLAIVLVTALIFYLGAHQHAPLNDRPITAIHPIDAASVEVRVESDDGPVAAQRKQGSSALQTVEKARQGSRPPVTIPTGSQNHTPETSSSEWQVLEHQTRKIR